MTYPELNDIKSNIGWPFNYSNIYGDLKLTPSENKKQTSGRVKKQIKKYWRPLNFQELEKIYDELNKQPEDLKTITDPKAFLC